MNMNIEQARHAMIEQQIRPWDVVDMQVLNTMLQVPRERFVPEQYQSLAFADAQLPLAHGQFMLKPVVEARMLQALALNANDEVLEIGTGSGFITACLASMARSVTSIDLYEDFISAARAHLNALDLNNVRLLHSDALNYEPNQQFDVIAVTAAVSTVPANFLEWLRPGGRLFVVEGDTPAQEALCITRTAEGFERKSLFETDVPYLLGTEPVDHFTL